MPVTSGSFNLDKWSWDNNHEVNFCSRERQHIDAFREVYKKVLGDCRMVADHPTPYSFVKVVKVSFWETFLWACNYFMNYRNMIKYEYRVVNVKSLYRERIIARGKKRYNIPEDEFRLYKTLNVDWDDAIGIDH